MPFNVKLDIPLLDTGIYHTFLPGVIRKRSYEVYPADTFYIFCPTTSQWSDEVWIAPKRKGKHFGEIDEKELADMSFVLSRLLLIFDLRHGHEFPFNFYIYTGNNWYIRIVPRVKTLGGFEVGTGVVVNTQKPQETMEFIKTHFLSPQSEQIEKEHQAEYWRSV